MEDKVLFENNMIMDDFILEFLEVINDFMVNLLLCDMEILSFD